MSKELTVAEIRTISTSAFKSGLAFGVKNQEAMFTMMMIAQSEGISPVQALNSYDLINGRIALKSNEALARYNDRGGRVKWIKTDKDSAKAIFTSKYNDPVEYEYTWEDAQEAGLAKKDNWVKNRKAMLRARCQIAGIRMSDPRALNNLYTSDEVAEMPQEEQEHIQEVEIIETPNTDTLKLELANKLRKEYNYDTTMIKAFATHYKLNEDKELLSEMVANCISQYVTDFENGE
jgi:hypothetical protein